MANTEYVWQIKDNQLSIMQKSGSVIITPTSAIGTIRIHVRYLPAPFTTDLTERLEFPSEFEMAPVAYVMEKLAVKRKDWESVRYWRGMWKDLIRDGKIAKNRGKDGTGFDVIVHDHFGD